MTQVQPTILLQSPIETLQLSDDFKKMAAINGFRTMDELLSFPLSSLAKKSGFTPGVQYELLTWLFNNGLIDELKQG